MLGAIQQWTSTAPNIQLWLAASATSLVLWLGIVFPIGYRVVGRSPFWTQMRQKPGLGALLVVVYVLFGPFLLYPAVVAVFCIILGAALVAFLLLISRLS